MSCPVGLFGFFLLLLFFSSFFLLLLFSYINIYFSPWSVLAEFSVSFATVSEERVFHFFLSSYSQKPSKLRCLRGYDAWSVVVVVVG